MGGKAAVPLEGRGSDQRSLVVVGGKDARSKLTARALRYGLSWNGSGREQQARGGKES